jgi:hypothetical protein
VPFAKSVLFSVQLNGEPVSMLSCRYWLVDEIIANTTREMFVPETAHCEPDTVTLFSVAPEAGAENETVGAACAKGAAAESAAVATTASAIGVFWNFITATSLAFSANGLSGWP